MVLHIVVIVLLILLSAFFSAAETAFTSLTFIQIRTLENEKGRVSRLVASLAKTSDLLLTTILIGNNIVNISASALTTTLALALGGNHVVGIAAGVLTLVILIFGEITPKQLAINYNVEVAKLSAYPIKGLTYLLYPIVAVVRTFSSLIIRLFGQKEGSSLSLESLMHVVDAAEDEGVVDQWETALVQKVLHFSEAPVKSVMTHRTEVFSLDGELALQEAFPLMVASGYARVPVYRETKEHIVGVLLLRDALAAEVEGRGAEKIIDFCHSPIYVPETRKLDAMMVQFQQEKLQLAVVLDEYGGLSGIVTLEDIVEQLFGEIYDEHETGELLRIKGEADGTFLIKADTTMQQIKDDLDLQIEREDLSCTLAAFLIEELGSIPLPGEKIEFPFGQFTILSMKGRRIESVRMKVNQKELH